MPDETYLGDGLYASFDGFSFWLRAPRLDGNHEVALEPLVLTAFLRFIEETKERLKRQQEALDALIAFDQENDLS